MKRCRPPFAIFRRFQSHYFDLRSSWRNDIAACRGSSRGEVALDSTSVCTGSFLGSRQYSSPAVNSIPIGSDDGRSNTMVEGSEAPKDFHQPSNLSYSSGSVDYRQNAAHFQHRSGLNSHHAVHDGTYTGNHGHYAAERTDLHNLDYSNGANGAASQQVSGHWIKNTGPCQQNPNSRLSGNMGTQSSLNVYHPSSHVAHLDNNSGYHNVQSRPQQDFDGSYHPDVLPKQYLSAATDVHSVEGGKLDDHNDFEGTLKEFDGFCQEWDLERALESMENLSESGYFIDLSRYLILVEVCGEAKALKEAKTVHEHLIKHISPINISTFNRILEMYGKCGSMQDALDTFHKMPERNMISWDTMITWFARNGLGEDAIDIFTKYKEVGLKPDGQMFFGLFEACGVIGDVTEGILHFESMSKIYGITPTMAHYASIAHMFGSAGDLDGALEFIEKMPVEPSVDVWESLMNISRIQGNIELGDRCAQIVEQLDPSRLTKESKTGLLPVKDSGKKVKKANPLDQKQHEYRAGDRSHPENDKIYTLLRGMKESMKESGYVPETRFVLHDIDQESKEEAIMAHSERLACAYALITSKPRMPLRIIKNLRVCGDCHNVFKIISKLVGRLVIMRDAKRFHHFEDGKCSCNDYW